VPLKRTLAEAFAYFDGAKAVNPRWAWAAQSDDGKTVVLTMWTDQISWRRERLLYQAKVKPGRDAWVKLQGNQDRIDKLQHAQNNCGGLFRAVIVEAIDTEARPRSTRSMYFADDELVMKLMTLNPTTGEFTALSVEPSNAHRPQR
jgi:hypothetical protein